MHNLRVRDWTAILLADFSTWCGAMVGRPGGVSISAGHLLRERILSETKWSRLVGRSFWPAGPPRELSAYDL